MQRTVVVTGASAGLGLALAQRLDGLGWRVLAGVRSEAGADAVRRAAPGAVPITLDVTDAAAIARATDAIAEHAGADGLDGLVNNAGIIVQGPLELVPIDAIRRQFEVNTLGPVAVTQPLLPLLRAAHGCIVNVGAISGRIAVPMIGPIAASKAALASFTDTLRMELRHQGVRVALVEPGAMQTEIFATAAAASKADGFAGEPATHARYAKAIDAAERTLDRQRPRPLDDAVSAIVKALTSRSPKARRLVGPDARAAAVLNCLPRPLRDRALTAAIGLNAKTFEAT